MRGWGFSPFVSLFRAFFNLLKSNKGFLNFCGRLGLSIFTGHKESIKHCINHFAIVDTKGDYDGGFELGC